MSVLMHGFVLFAAFLTGPLLALASAQPVVGEIMLVIAAPRIDAAALVQASGGRVIGPATTVMGTLAIADHPDFVADLKSNGAWIVRDGAAIARLCGVSV